MIVSHEDPAAVHRFYNTESFLMLCGQQGDWLLEDPDDADLTCCGCVTVVGYPDTT